MKRITEKSILFLFLGSAGLGSFTGCELYVESTESHANEANTSTGESSPHSDRQYRYQFVVDGCDTGEHVYSTQTAFCEALRNNQLNNGCAEGLREQLYLDSECPESWQVVYPSPGTWTYDRAYEFARNIRGLSRFESEQFAARQSSRESLEVYIQAYLFAQGSRGKIWDTEIHRFAKEAQTQGRRWIGTYQKVYRFGRDMRSLSDSQSDRFAREFAVLWNGETLYQIYQEEYVHSRNLGLSDRRADRRARDRMNW